MSKSIFWFRRDLRFEDNHGLYEALKESDDVIPVFIFDQNILDELEEDDPRVTFIHREVSAMNDRLSEFGSIMHVSYGDPISCWKKIIKKFDVDTVYTNHDFEPYAIKRDQEVEQLLEKNDLTFKTFKDHVLFEKREILTGAGGVYTVFTPYKRKWLVAFGETYLTKAPKRGSFYPSEKYLDKMSKGASQKIPALKKMGFVASDLEIPSKDVARSIVKSYEEKRNFPALEKGTSRLGIHFRFGTISIREKALKAYHLSDVYLSELVWRDFYAQILANYPHVVERAFRPKYDRIQWRDSQKDFELWCSGTTGYPLVDAGMRELNATGFMHNRVRMVTASFLTKHLLIDWRLGEAYFAKKLLDFDLASNNGGWQWASGSGTDAAPYFRIFNPTSQMEKFDKQRIYIKRWVPEFGTEDYPEPMVDHKFARERCLTTYKAGLADV